jgi:hypothetical protein
MPFCWHLLMAAASIEAPDMGGFPGSRRAPIICESNVNRTCGLWGLVVFGGICLLSSMVDRRSSGSSPCCFCFRDSVAVNL